ncbi:Glycosyl hydrolase family 65, N-terminal domain/Glycosyl hydrolase family 65 central catalytic domain/Glycosyl hydrolase family 65, C-terminal domain/Haloacid dehalogenase-like hydrolase, putative [Angomonas deanei]|uniref:Glycosyl hydrolase family 65, N-terminal domain/Glycosyl hydrolase family 65 central catalytic domain/Glycosyl hydrolase family 65, C-terminal domain/Haloacid dehalogenase-like hydrolase, putative n=1 Tax=Angomonas deanei TaxID=59799 RepID=A0A7G2C1M4_9TRYP|nr:Glycosyl hydrolase family 65, N-terminal domain/Glycosyl hydrolase family 65 central catalytic domain/Glycosyl hydrolase family 65, C-terminal domain/Haloacid dehalogenase-like hydrolase, putative [Angomonas deanei]
MSTVDKPRSKIQCGSWELRETSLAAGEEIPVNETLFSLSNGVIGLRGFTEESEHVFNYYPGGTDSTTGCESRSSNISNGGRSTKTSHPAKVDNVYVDSELRIPEKSLRGTFFAGFYERRLLNRSRIFSVGLCTKECFLVKAPDAFCIDVFIAGEHVNSSSGRFFSQTRKLDLRTGEMRRRVLWESHSGKELAIECTRIVSSVRKNIAAVKYTITARNVNNTDIRIVSRTDTSDGRMGGFYDVENVFTSSDIQEATSGVFVRTRNSCRHLGVVVAERCSSFQSVEQNRSFEGAVSLDKSNTSINEESTHLSTPLANNSSNFPLSPVVTARSTTFLSPKCVEVDSGVETTFTSCISEKTCIELEKYVGLFGDESAQQEDLTDLALQKTRMAAKDGWVVLVEEHRRKMNAFWSVANVHLKGIASLQGAIRFNMLELKAAYNRSSCFAYPTHGLTGEMLGGLQQWEVDAFITPYMSHIHPESASALLRFRIKTLNYAKEIAADLDLPRGALWPHRTLDGSDNPSTHCAAFLFMNTVVAYALHQYVIITNDNNILLEGGAELLLTTALVYIEWGTWDGGVFHIRSVSGPDIYNGVVDNNFFTNVMAQHHLRWTLQIAGSLRENNPDQWAQLLAKCNMTEEDLTHMEKAAQQMFLLFDGKHRVYPVDQAFMSKKKWNLHDLRDKTKKNLIAEFHPNVIYRHQVCHIPDVLLVMTMLPTKFTMDEVKTNLHFYEPKTAVDSPLCHAIFAILYAAIGQTDEATKHFRRGLLVDVQNSAGNTGGGFHLSTAAASWQALVHGFGGMRVLHGVLHFNPTLPDNITEYEFNARHRGCLVRVSVTQKLVIYNLVDSPRGVEQLLISHKQGQRILLQKDKPESVRLFHDARVLDFDAIIFELDSIVDNIESIHYCAWKETLEEYFKMTEFTLTKELYLAYLSHGKPFAGLNEIFKKYNKPVLPTGDNDDGEETKTLYGLCQAKLEKFRAKVKRDGLKFREGAFKFLSHLRQSDICVGCVSGSRNGKWLVKESPQLNMSVDKFLDNLDGEEMMLRWRPETDYFSFCSRSMDCSSKRTIIVLDGIDGFSKSALEKFCMVIDVSENPAEYNLSVPTLKTQSFKDITVTTLDEITTSELTRLGNSAGGLKRKITVPDSFNSASAGDLAESFSLAT